MDSALPPSEIEAEDSRRDLRGHYEAVAQDTLRLLWLKRPLIAKSIAAALCVAVIYLVHVGPRYTGEALIDLDFHPAQPVAGRSAPASAAAPVTVDGIGVLKSTAHIIGSRAIADAVVDRLALDKDPNFTRRSLFSRGMSLIRWLLGLQPTTPSARGIAADNLRKRLQVTTGERAYVISILANAGDPKTAAALANALAAEYWRARTLNELLAARSEAGRNLAQIALVYGPRLPNYQEAQTRVQELEGQVRALRAAAIPAVIGMAAGHWLIPAQEVAQPSGPNVPVILLLAVLVGFSAGALLARYGIEPRLPPRWSSPRLQSALQSLRQRLRANPRLRRARPVAREEARVD